MNKAQRVIKEQISVGKENLSITIKKMMRIRIKIIFRKQ
jgi:hypothetical protein